MSLAEAGESHAEEWIRLARAPRHDGFWDGTWPELVALLPPPSALAIDIGCGEGRSSRELIAAGHRVVGVEQSLSLSRAARTGEPNVLVLRADAAALPVQSGSCSLVVASMVLQGLDDLPGTAGEIARVLLPGGHFCFAIVHPFSSAEDEESFRSEETAATVSRSYLTERPLIERVERDGLSMTFVSAHRPLSAYVDALGTNRLAIEALREFGQRAIPWLLVARAVRMSSD